MTRTFIPALIIAASLCTSAALADDNDDNIKCLAVSLNMSMSDDPADQSVGMLSTMYWMGKVDGSTPNADLETELNAAFASMKATEIPGEKARCAAALTPRGQLLSKIGQDRVQKQNSN